MTDTAPIDFRDFRPVAVIIVDLVKHSQRNKAQIYSIQKILISVLETAVQRVNLSNDVIFNYTGDGYVIAFCGDSSTRIIDFINAAFPLLKQKLIQHEQQYRVGIDFGIAHISTNPLTHTKEHFDLPGIIAARLESSAQAGQILCSETVHRLFSHHYPGMFDSSPIVLETKDRIISCYEVKPTDFTDVRQHLENIIFRKISPVNEPIGSRKKILLVDDDRVVLESLKIIISIEFSNFIIEGVLDSTQVMNVVLPNEYALVATDEMMPGLLGSELTERLVALDENLPIVMLTAFSTHDVAKRFFAAGGTYFVEKPFDINELNKIFHMCISSNVSIRKKLNIIAHDIGQFLMTLQQVSDSYNKIMMQASESKDLASSLLRHKSKQVVYSFLDTVLPGNDVTGSLKRVLGQLKCVYRLLHAVERSSISSINKYLSEYACNMMQLNPGTTIQLRWEIKSPKLLPHAEIITLIMCELIDNAIAAIGNDGTVLATVSLLPAIHLLRLEILDTGPGVPFAIRESMFEAGVSTKGEERGLGLCLVKEAVSKLKGNITYEYKDGALFSILIPV